MPTRSHPRVWAPKSSPLTPLTPLHHDMTMPLTAVATPALLSSLRTHPTLPRHSWYLISAVALSALNRPDEIGSVLQHALAHDGSGETPLGIARRMREALVKSAPIGGLPRVRGATCHDCLR